MDLAEAIELYGDTYGLNGDQLQHLVDFAGVLLLNGLVRPNDHFDVVYYPDGTAVFRPRQMRLPLTPGRDYKHLPASNEWSSDDEA